MSIDARLARLSPALNAQERAVLILEAWKADRPEDPQWRRSMPPDQFRAFNRYIDLMNQANVTLPRLIHVLAAQVETIELRKCWLTDAVLWQEHIEEIRHALRYAVRQPLTQSEYDAKVQQQRDRWAPVRDLAEYLADQREDWADEDYEDTAEWGRVVSEEASDRAVVAEERRLRELVAQGKLPAKGKGKKLKIQQGAFDDLLGCQVSAYIEGLDEHYDYYRVVPDAEAEGVATERSGLERLQNTLDWRFGSEAEDLKTMPDLMISGLKEGLALRLISTWVEMRCAEIVLDGIAAEFGVEDALLPRFREVLQETHVKLKEIGEQLEYLRVRVVLREPLEEEMAETRRWVSEIS
jgi:hypothetical protein